MDSQFLNPHQKKENGNEQEEEEQLYGQEKQTETSV
jgi:hypothetical protein